MPEEILGIDLNGVIRKKKLEGKNEAQEKESFLVQPPMEGAFEGIYRLRTERFGGNIFIISKSSEEKETKRWEWLKHHDAFTNMGIKQSQVIFSRERAEKAIICQKMRVTHYVDDRIEVIRHMNGLIPNLYLFCSKVEETEKYKDFLAGVTIVNSWEELLFHLLPQ